jgi:phage tail sheath gpL-like
MSISYNQILATIRTPGVFVEVDASRASQGVGDLPHVTLLVGQMTSAGVATSGSLYQPRSPDDARALFGNKSQLAQQFAAYRAVDSLTEVWCIPLADNGSGVAATGSIVWTGTATEAGSLLFYVGGRRVSVAVTVGMTAAQLETAALAAFALETDLPVTVGANASTGVDFTAVTKGVSGNAILLGINLNAGERLPAGFSFTPTAMSAGATEPAHSAAITAMGEDQYHTVVVGTSDATQLALYVTEMESRFGPMRQIDGQIFVGKYDSQANLTTYGNSFNSNTLTVCGAEASALELLPWEIAARVAAASALQAQVQPARALTGKTLAGALAAPRGSRFTRAQRDILLSDGVSTFSAASDGRLAIERLVTTYQTNALSIPDTAFQDLTTCRLLSALRHSMRVRLGTKFANFLLANDGSEVSGQPVATPSIIKGELLNLFQDWAALAWVEKGTFEQFKAELVVERNASDPNRIDIICPPDLMNNLLVTAASLQFRR